LAELSHSDRNGGMLHKKQKNSAKSEWLAAMQYVWPHRILHLPWC